MRSLEREKRQQFKREELERRKNAIFFTVELILVCSVSILSVWVLLSDYPFYVKTTCGGLLVYITRSVIRHLTNKI